MIHWFRHTHKNSKNYRADITGLDKVEVWLDETTSTKRMGAPSCATHLTWCADGWWALFLSILSLLCPFLVRVQQLCTAAITTACQCQARSSTCRQSGLSQRVRGSDAETQTHKQVVQSTLVNTAQTSLGSVEAITLERCKCTRRWQTLTHRTILIVFCGRPGGICSKMFPRFQHFTTLFFWRVLTVLIFFLIMVTGSAVYSWWILLLLV